MNKLALIALSLCLVPACVGSPDEVPGDDVAEPADPIEPTAPTVDPVEPTLPFACKAGETVEIGKGIDRPELAGTRSGYALLFREEWRHREPTFMVFDQEGWPSGAATLLPSSDYIPTLTGNDDGYVIQSVLPSSYQSSFFWAGQDGSIVASATDAQWAGMSIALTDSGLRGVTLTGAPECVDGPFAVRFAVGDLGQDGGLGGLVPGPCMKVGGWWMHGFAAHSDSAIFLTQVQTLFTEARQEYDMTVTVFADGGHRQFVIAHSAFGASGGADFAEMHRVVSTEDGYAILWSRINRTPVGTSTNRSFMTYVSADGDLLGSVELSPYAQDIVWNGREFGLVRDAFVDGVRSAVIDRLTLNGQKIESLAVPVTGDVGTSLRIASSGDDFAVAYGIYDGQGSYDLSLVPIVCQ